MSGRTEVEQLNETLLTAYADLWAHYHALVRAIGMTGVVNDGRLAVDAQIVMEEQGDQLAMEGRRRLEALMAERRESHP